MYPHSKFGIPTSKQNKIYDLDMFFLELGSEAKVKITVTQKQYATLCDTKVYPHTKFGTPASNYKTDKFRTRFRFRLTDCQLCFKLAWSSSPLVAAKSAELSDVNVKANHICMIECAYDAVGWICISYRTTSCPGGSCIY